MGANAQVNRRRRELCGKQQSRFAVRVQRFVSCDWLCSTNGKYNLPSFFCNDGRDYRTMQISFLSSPRSQSCHSKQMSRTFQGDDSYPTRQKRLPFHRSYRCHLKGLRYRMACLQFDEGSSVLSLFEHSRRHWTY